VFTAQSGAVRPTFLGVLLCSPKERKPHRVWFGYSDGLVKTARPVRLAAFDLDGTLLRGDTVCEVLARTLGHLERMRELEAIQEARQDRDSLLVLRKELAAYYRGVPALELRSYLSTLTLAPGAREGFALLRRAGIVTAIVSITWEFAAQWLAAEVGADYHVGTRLLADGSIEHFWPEDKAVWLAALRRRHGSDGMRPWRWEIRGATSRCSKPRVCGSTWARCCRQGSRRSTCRTATSVRSPVS